MNEEKECRILSIDAWREEEGWTWNDWFSTGYTIPIDMLEKMSDRQLIKYCRDELSLLSIASKGKVAVEDDQYNKVIIERSTRRPLYAIEYGCHY